ncbi:MAG: DNA (cytosine-5-)-methyltransferase [Gordonibacter sp.]
MRYISLFSGIEAASVAWIPLGWEAVALSEVDPFCNTVLKTRFPTIPNLGDIRNVDWSHYHGKANVVIGGSPCQSFSIAGKREGLKGESGLMFEYIRAIRGILPECFVWENVPGALSSEDGRAFGCLLREMDALGYGLAWRILDAQFFSLAQRRERVFLVGVLGSAARACEVLFEPEGVPWGAASSKEKRAQLAAAARTRPSHAGFKYAAAASAGSLGYALEQSPTLTSDWHCPAVCYGIVGNAIGRSPENGGNGLGFCNPDKDGMYTLTAADRHAVACETQYGREVAGALAARADSSPCADRGPSMIFAAPPSDPMEPACTSDPKGAGTQLVADAGITCMASTHSNASIGNDACGCLAARAAKDAPVVAFAQNERDEVRLIGGDGDHVGTIAASPGIKQASHVLENFGVRRLTPTECERLQGFPDDWTNIEYRGKPAPDTQRYKSLGNSMAVPVVQWIGKRIERALSADQPKGTRMEDSKLDS